MHLQGKTKLHLIFPSFVFHKCVDLQRVGKTLCHQNRPRQAMQSPRLHPKRPKRNEKLWLPHQKNNPTTKNYGLNKINCQNCCRKPKLGSKASCQGLEHNNLPKNSHVFYRWYASSVPPEKKKMFGHMTAQKTVLILEFFEIPGATFDSETTLRSTSNARLL